MRGGLAVVGLIGWLAYAGGCGDDAGSSTGTAGTGGSSGSGGSAGDGGGAGTSGGGSGGMVGGGGSGGMVGGGGSGGAAGASAGGAGGDAGTGGTGGSGGGAAGTGGAAGAGGTAGGAAVTEVESNNTAATANDFAAIAVNGRVTAAIGVASDNDFFSLTIPAGTTALYITTFSTGVDTTCTSANTTLTLFAADATTTLASNTNISATKLCSHISYAPTPGTYFVRVNANSATSTFGYVLAVRAETIPTATAETEPNEAGSPSIGNGMDSFEGNDFDIANAGGPFSADALITGALMPTGDEDVFAIHNTGAEPAEVYLETSNGGFGACTAGLDTQIRIRDASGAVLAFGDDAGLNRFCSFLPYVIPAGATVYAHIIDFGDNTTAAAYSLHVSFP
jgi:Bacterial pre-peptidase C-terminal domain